MGYEAMYAQEPWVDLSPRFCLDFTELLHREATVQTLQYNKHQLDWLQGSTVVNFLMHRAGLIWRMYKWKLSEEAQRWKNSNS